MSSPRFGPAAELLGTLELAVLRQLWTTSPATVRTVLEGVNRERGEELAYTSVMTVLDRLHGKGLVTRDRHGRAWRYTARYPTEDALVDHLGRLEVERLVERLGDVALVQFAATLDDLDPRTRRRLERLAARDDG